VDDRPSFLPTTRWWGVVASAVLLCVPLAQPQAQVFAGGGQVAAKNSGFRASTWGNSKADRMSADPSGKYSAALDPSSLYAIENAIGARGLWAQTDASGRALTGQGIGVALLDSGVSQIAGLSGAGKVTHGPDLSIEGNGDLIRKDTFGHGTFMAGIIAGRGTTTPSSSLASTLPGVQLGVAPDAKILSMKLATTDGSTDVSQVIAALDWVTQHPVMPDGTRVRVINLSYGTNSTQGYLADPLAAAVENAWRHGIVVVVSAGNNGWVGRLTNPAIDPYVLAVGATDNNLNVNGWVGDTTKVAAFSQVGSTTRHVDLVAPGTSLVSIRAPGSFIDVNNPSGLVAGDVSGTLFRGSGTSQAAAVVSGTVALLLQACPTLTPDQVKYVLRIAARPIKGATVTAAGAGTLDLLKTLGNAGNMAGTTSNSARARGLAEQKFVNSTGQGSIEAARGGSSLVDAAGVPVTGEIDVQGNPWTPTTWWRATSNLSSWSGGKWLGATWTGDNWEPAPDGLSSARWSASRWSSARWSTADWTSARWSASRWSASRWSDLFWS
jgi:serine protease AprX